MSVATIRPETEKQFQSAVVDAARRLGWRVYHTFDSRRSASGFPDLVMVRRGRMICVELKSDRGRVSIAQKEWLMAIESCQSIEVGVWRPADKTSILEALR